MNYRVKHLPPHLEARGTGNLDCLWLTWQVHSDFNRPIIGNRRERRSLHLETWERTFITYSDTFLDGCSLAPKVLLDYLRPMITIHPIHIKHWRRHLTTKMTWDDIRWSDYDLTTSWQHSDYIPTTFWLYSDYILTTFWLHSDYILNTFWLHSDYILGTFWLHSGYILATFWLHSGKLLAIFWLHFGYINNCWRSVPLPCGQFMAIFHTMTPLLRIYTLFGVLL